MNSEAITGIKAPIYLKYNFTAGAAAARFLTQIKKGVLTGQRCPKCSAVYVPPRGSCAACGVATEEEVVLSDKATVQSFTIVSIPIPNNPIQPPYIIANLVPDGANVSFIHLMSECVNEEIHIGQRVQAVWKPQSGMGLRHGQHPLLQAHRRTRCAGGKNRQTTRHRLGGLTNETNCNSSLPAVRQLSLTRAPSTRWN